MDIVDIYGNKSRRRLELYLFYSPIVSFENVLLTRQNIQTLVIIGQHGITSFNAISELVHLEELWIVESGIQEIPCFKRNCQLKKLFLYSNELTCIPNLEVCSRLTVLCLSGNRIYNLENLNKLTWLQELSLADNKIERISKVSLKKLELQYLNLAGNLLSFIRDVRSLTQLRKLNSLVFTDPLYGDCPLIGFCNYRPYIIYYIPQIKKLDHFSVSDKERCGTNRFFKKQITYYNVLLHKQLSMHLMFLKHIHKEYQETINYFKNKLYVTKVKENKAPDKFRDVLLEMELSKKQFLEAKEMEIIQSKILQQQLVIGMKYCGNIHFVEYNTNSENTIIQLCKQFLEESLCSMIKHGVGITGLRLHKVTKVYNKQIDELTALNNTSPQSDVYNVILKILVSFGVSDIKKWPFNFLKTGLFTEKQIILTNCLAVADAEWLNEVFAVKEKEVILKTLSSCERRRVCILTQAPILNSNEKINIANDYLHTKYVNYWNNSNEICHKYKLMRTDIKNPLFIVEYEYVSNKLTNENGHKNPVTACVSNDNLYIHLSNFNITQYIKTCDRIDLYNLVTISICGHNISSIDINLDLPNLKELDISFNCLEKFPNSNIIKNLKQLNISFNNIQLIHIQNSLDILETLDVSWNCLMNCLKSIKEFIYSLPNIQNINICDNPFQDIIDPELVRYLLYTYMPKLQFINNCSPDNISLPKHYFPCAFNMCELNNKRHSKLIYLPQKVWNSAEQSNLMDEKSIEHAKYIHMSENCFLVSGVLERASKLQELCATYCLLSTFPVIKPLKYLIKLSLGSNFISSMENFTQENFPLLKYLDLSNNLITTLEEMGTFYTLQEFYCGNNSIVHLTQIDNIKMWHMLRVVDFSNNPITTDELYKQFIIFHIDNIKYISGEHIQNSDISEAQYIFGNKLDKRVLCSVYKTARLTNITQLSLVDCSLSKVDISAELLPHLESLDLSRNQITYLCGFYSFQYLHTLCLSHNCLEIFCESKCVLPQLCTLYLDHNCIKTVGNFTEENLPMIKHLFLNNNCLCSITDIHNCSTLETLILDHNELETINEEDLMKNCNLKTLSLENNKLKSLEFIKSLHKLEKLYVANNCLTDVTEMQSLLLLKNLEELTFEGNPVYDNLEVNKMIVQDFELKNIDAEDT